MLLRLSDKSISNFLACVLTDIMKHPLSILKISALTERGRSHRAYEAAVASGCICGGNGVKSTIAFEAHSEEVHIESAGFRVVLVGIARTIGYSRHRVIQVLKPVHSGEVLPALY